jgi:hypothetical protein
MGKITCSIGCYGYSCSPLLSSTIVSGLFPGSGVVLDIGTHHAFPQQQNQTDAATTGNNTNTTITAAPTIKCSTLDKRSTPHI